ncbi:DUF6794 domain-containing protein [Brumimicrobium mesophilum]|uniref:DUF6794 domain-containing protein n=1 Tax=Brumimicrobium mesophilum TaxID=392717 RepID=UPI000D140D0E|nr:DUF6794 domain-containing protein [Brumimicrobium mesophilum]
MKFGAIILITFLIYGCIDNSLTQSNFNQNAYNHVRSITSCDSLIVDSVFIANESFTLDSKTPIPQSIFEAVVLLDENSNLFTKHKFSVCNPIEFHHGLGTWIRNNWGLWSGGNLAEELMTTFEIEHPDDMSMRILVLNYICQQKDKYAITDFFNEYGSRKKNSLADSKQKELEIKLLRWKEDN